jgi:pilus assembly protein CpaF
MKGYSEEYIKLLEKIKQQQSKLFWQTGNAVTVIKQYLIDTNIRLNNYSTDEAAEKLYNDIFNYSVLTNPLKDIWVQSIQINSWNEVYVHFINGKSVQIDGFNSPDHAKKIIKSLLKVSNLDVTQPMISGKLKNNIRITAFFTPIVKDSISVCCTIQKLKKREFSSQDYLLNDFAAKKELDFLLTVLNYGVSVLLVGNRGAGKTTFMQYLLSSIHDKSIITVEENERELNTGANLLISKDMNSKEFIYNLMSLTPDIVGCNLDREILQGLSLNGCTVLASMFADTAEMGLRLAAEKWRERNSNIDYNTALNFTCGAFPIIVTLHTYKDMKRRISNISECSFINGNIKLKTLWEYQMQSVENKGQHKQISDVSDTLLSRMKINEITLDKIDKLKKEEINYAGS